MADYSSGITGSYLNESKKRNPETGRFTAKGSETRKAGSNAPDSSGSQAKGFAGAVA